jgi:ribosomal protein S10
MAKRFGRNQKRKMRSEIERLHRVDSDRQKWMYKALNTESRLISWAKRMNSIIGPEHPLNESVQRIMVQRVPNIYEKYRFRESYRMNISDALTAAMISPEIALNYIKTVLHVIDVQRDKITPSVTVKLMAPDKQCYYAIDEQELQEGRRDSRFVQWISDELALKLSAFISE